MDSSTSKPFIRVLFESTVLLTVASALLSFLGATYLGAFYQNFHIQFWTLDLPIYTFPFFSSTLFPKLAIWMFILAFLIPWGSFVDGLSRGRGASVEKPYDHFPNGAHWTVRWILGPLCIVSVAFIVQSHFRLPPSWSPLPIVILFLGTPPVFLK